MRWRFNLFPAYRGTGGWVTYIASDWSEIRVRLPLTWRTRNYVGTLFGGSIYAAVDPIYMMMLIKLLGPDYVVWDKAATIRFRRPGRSALEARFVIKPAMLEEIRAELKHLIAEIKTVNQEIQQAVDGQLVDPDTYHLNYLDRIKIMLKNMLKQLGESRTWLTTQKSRKKQMGYWNQYKKKGTSFGLNHERTVATQVG